jgi:outer membrane immunogenic protein
MSYKASMACAGAFAAAATLAGTAFAAEPAPLPPPVPIFTWNGLYVGAQIGYAWGRDPVTWSGISNDDELAAGTFSHSPQGVIGGAHVGYNLQYKPWLVFGLEGSFDGTSLSHALVYLFVAIRCRPVACILCWENKRLLFQDVRAGSLIAA